MARQLPPALRQEQKPIAKPGWCSGADPIPATPRHPHSPSLSANVHVALPSWGRASFSPASSRAFPPAMQSVRLFPVFPMYMQIRSIAASDDIQGAVSAGAL